MTNCFKIFFFSCLFYFGIYNQILFAVEDGVPSGPLDFLWKVLNILILVGIIYWFARKPISSTLRTSAENAKKRLDESRETEELTKAQLKQMREKLTGLEKESLEMLAKARLEAQAEKKRIIEEGKREIVRMREHARISIEQEYRKAEHRLRQWVATESVKLAEEKLKQKMSGNHQNKLFNEYLDQLSLDKEAS